MKYRFQYNGDLDNSREEAAEGELTYHQHLQQEDGKVCDADFDYSFKDVNGRLLVDATFEDGSELTVYEDELTEIDEGACGAAGGPVQPAKGGAE